MVLYMKRDMTANRKHTTVCCGYLPLLKQERLLCLGRECVILCLSPLTID